MRYVGKQPREGINVSDTHPLVEAGTLVVGLAGILVIITLLLVYLVEVALYFVSPEEEADLFRNWLPEDLITVSPFDERLAESQLLLDRLATHWPENVYELRIEIDDSELANAYALPGGLIVVTRGLLDEVESENELAFVIGHEIGHFSNRDHIRMLGRGAALSLAFAVVMGGDISGIGVSAADATLRSFSRKQERSADEFGLNLVQSEYGHVNQAWRLFERWDEQGRTVTGLSAYFATHPATADRIDKLKVFAELNGWSADGDITALKWPPVTLD